MALPSNTTISISQIRTELGSASGSLRTLSSLAGKSTPDAMSEFWGYSSGPPTIYWNGGLTMTYSGPTYAGMGQAGMAYAFNYHPNAQTIAFLYGPYETWDIDSSSIEDWDRYVLDGGSPQNNFVFANFYDRNNIGSGYLSVYATPPSGRSFYNINTSQSANTVYTYYDFALNYVSFSFYGNDPRLNFNVATVDLYFTLI